MSSVVQHAPKFNEVDAARIAKELFGLDGTAGLLPSERDQNFRLTTAGDESYVLKIANSTEPEAVLDFQNQAMMHLRSRRGAGLRHISIAPEVCLSVDGHQIASTRDDDGTTYLVRLLTYLPGRPLAHAKPHNEDLMFSLGQFFGNLSQLLKDFDHPATHRDFHWDLKNAGRIIPEYMDLIRDPHHQKLVQQFLERYQAVTEPQLADLPTGVIHSDGNDYNVLVEPDSSRRNHVTGVIDFGDMVYSKIINEIAIVCAYAMLDKADPMAPARAIIAGYHKAHPLTEAELAVLFDLICMRLCMSVCHSANQSRHEPDNEYLRISEKPAWDLLKKLAGIHPHFACFSFRQAGGFPPVPHYTRTASWLEQNRDSFGPLVDDDLQSDDLLMLDLSVGSLLLGDNWNGGDEPALTAKIFSRMQAAGVEVGIGRYNEARLVYTSEAFRVQTDELPEHRTVHLGIDLYKHSGAPIYAPLDGVVFSFADNEAPLDYGPTIILQHRIDDHTTFYTLYGHLDPASLNELEIGAPVVKGRQIGTIGKTESNGGWTPHLHFQIILDLLGESVNFPGVARPGERDIWLSICPDPNLILDIPERCLETRTRGETEILDMRRRNLGRNLSISYRKPLKIVRGRRQYLYAEDGRRFIDGVNNVCHVGHCHPHVVAAGQLQMPVLNTNTRYLHDNIIEYARRLLSKFPEPLDVCFFVCTGSEANELALRLARNYTGRKDILMVDGAYHGNTQALIDISPYKHDRPGGRGAPAWAHSIVMPDGYRGPHKGTGPETGTRYAAYVKATIEQIRKRGDGFAAFICESMLGCGGQIVLPDNYLREAFKHVRAGGGLCIVDEVQVGFGRAGSHYWAFESQNVVPDIVTLGKPIGNGHPLAAVITTAEIADAFANGMEYFNTFGGNPVSCAIGMAVLDVIENEGLQENAHRVGRHLLDGLQGLKNKYPLVGDVRGLGLYVGVELVKNRETLEPATEEAGYVINRMRDHGILISTAGPLDTILKLKPPLVFSRKNAEQVVAVLDRVLGEDYLQVSPW